MEPRIEYARAEDGASIACTAIGQGPAIVLSGNFGGDLTHFSHAGLPFVDQFVAAGHRVIFYDHRGTGASDREFGPSTPDTRLSDLESVIDRMVDGPFAVIGRGHGGALAIAYAARHNDRVTHLVCVDGYVRGSDYYAATPYTRAIRALTGIAEDDWEFFTLALANFAVGFRDPERAARLAAAFKSGMTPLSYMQSVESAEAVDVSALLSLISVPTLAIHDRSAVLSDPRAVRSIASGIAGAQSMLVRSSQETAEAIIEFIAASPMTSAGVAEARVQTGTRTVLFTDIVGHTEMMQRLGDAKGRNVLREHERITRETLRAHGGAPK
jgi:pimeloyl-ACP methyl ester carboxylesterase